MDSVNYQISISPKAAEKIQEKLLKRGTPDAHVRLGVRGGGCSGYSYALIFEDDAPGIKDLTFESQGINLVVDKKSILYLNGCVLDWEQTLMNHGFKFVNPNEKSRCGCGHSFHT